MDPLPREAPKGKKLVAHEVFKSLEPARATFEEYQAMVADRPEKFSAEDVNYRKAEDPGQECEHCIHYFQQVAGKKRRTCEIFRPENEDVDPEWVCDFMTRDGKTYPYQPEEDSSQRDEEEEREGSRVR